MARTNFPSAEHSSTANGVARTVIPKFELISNQTRWIRKDFLTVEQIPMDLYVFCSVDNPLLFVGVDVFVSKTLRIVPDAC